MEIEVPGGHFAVGDELPVHPPYDWAGPPLGAARVVAIKQTERGARITLEFPQAAVNLLNSGPEPLEPGDPERVVRLVAQVGAGN